MFYQHLSHLVSKNIDFFKTWRTHIAINKFKDLLKRQRYTEELKNDLEAFYDMPTEEMSVVAAICKLGSNKSIYITLYFYNDMTYKEYKNPKHHILGDIIGIVIGIIASLSVVYIQIYNNICI